MTRRSYEILAVSREGSAPPHGGFVFMPTDDTDIVHPTSGDEVLARFITSTVEGVVKVTYANDETAIVPVLARVPRAGFFTKIWATDTTAGIVSAGVLVEY